jgi:dihydrofolate reductase
MKHFQAIAAMARNRVIGAGNTIPWHLPDDFRWFRQKTTGHILLMGRRTYESIGRPLPHRATWVLTRSRLEIPGVRIVRDLGAIDPAAEPATIFICGGAQVYAQALPACSDLFLTRLKREVPGDTFFPEFEHAFEAVDEPLDHPEFTVVHYRNRQLAP